MTENDALKTIRDYRDELATRHSGDAWSLVRELTEQVHEAGRETVRLPRREPQPPRAPLPQPAA